MHLFSYKIDFLTPPNKDNGTYTNDIHFFLMLPISRPPPLCIFRNNVEQERRKVKLYEHERVLGLLLIGQERRSINCSYLYRIISA